MKLTDIEKYNEAIEFRDWQTCDLIADEHKGLQSKLKEQSETIESMKGLIKELVEVCEFYGNHYYWSPSGQISKDDVDDTFISDSGPFRVAGKRARQVLSKNKELIKAIKGE